MELGTTVRWATKGGHEDNENQDVWRLAPTGAETEHLTHGPLRVVVCDGATATYLAGRWARMVADTFTSAPVAAFRRANTFAAAATKVAVCWPGELAAYLQEREVQGRPIRWSEEPSLERGPGTTLLGLHLAWSLPKHCQPQKSPVPVARPVTGQWYAAAFGDTNLFHVRADKLLHAFPLTSVDEFDDRPLLLGTTNYDTNNILARVRFAKGDLVAGDRLYICTDALAVWFLARNDNDEIPWTILDDLDEAAFDAWLQAARNTGHIENDDTTFVSIRCR